MYHIIYETTNTITGMKYLGKHSTNDINDGYLGSGIRLKNAIKKYGKEFFERKIIYFCSDLEELNLLERQLINDDIVLSDEYYNIAKGGVGGITVLFKEHPNYKEVCQKISKAVRGEVSRTRVKKQYENAKANGKLTCMQGKRQSEYQKQVVKENGEKRIGKNNPNFGKRKYFPPDAKSKKDYLYYDEGTQPIDWIPCKDWRIKNDNC